MFYDLITILSRPYIIKAFIVGLTMALSGSLLGVSLVLKKQSMIGDGLSHVGFGAVAIACCIGVAPLVLAIPLVIISSIFIMFISQKNKYINESSIALFSTIALAIGYAAIELSSGVNFNISSYLYGSLLGCSVTDCVLSIIICLIVVGVYVILYNKIFSVTFDETFAKSQGINTNLINLLLSILTSLTVVIGMKVMGALLITALIIFPTISSRQIFKSFKNVLIFACILSVVACSIGIITSCIIDRLPIGSSIVFVNFICFIICYIIGKVKLHKSIRNE